MSLVLPILHGEPLTFENRFAVVDATKADGWELRGSGSFSRVLAKGERMLKIFSDDAYLQYVMSDLVQRGHEAAPRLLDPIMYGDGLNVALLEPLVFRPRTDHEDSIVAGLHMIAEDIIENGIDAAVASFMSDDFQIAREWLEPSGSKFFVRLLRFIDDTGMRPDIKSENLMTRPSTGQIVFNDPVAQPVSKFLKFFKK